jgi:hypothetical protein
MATPTATAAPLRAICTLKAAQNPSNRPDTNNGTITSPVPEDARYAGKAARGLSSGDLLAVYDRELSVTNHKLLAVPP